MVNQINRRPINENSSEATYRFYVICRRNAQAEVREKLVEVLEAAAYPVRDVDQHPFGQSDAEIQATLYATAVDSVELDRISAEMETLDGVTQAFWNTSAEA